jgi:hypothetical protein
MAPKGIALCIGLNEIDPNVYKADSADGLGVRNELKFAERDAKAMLDIALGQHFRQAALLLTEAATRDAVLRAVEHASRCLRPGDLFLLTFSGHGTRVPDGVKGNEIDFPPEADGMDEAWCLYDGLLLDDDLRNALSRGLGLERVRILLVSDSCYNGTIVDRPSPTKGVARSFDPDQPPPKVVLRSLPHYDVGGSPARWVNRSLTPTTPASFFLSDTNRSGSARPIKAPTLCFTASLDTSTTKEVDGNGKFTKHLLATWSEGNFRGNYAEFRDQIIPNLDGISPSYYWIEDNNTFELETPFHVTAPPPSSARGAPLDGDATAASPSSPRVPAPLDFGPSPQLRPAAVAHQAFASRRAGQRTLLNRWQRILLSNESAIDRRRRAPTRRPRARRGPCPRNSHRPPRQP